MSKKILIGLAIAGAVIGIVWWWSRHRTEISGGGAPTPAVTLPRPDNPRVGSPTADPAQNLANTIAGYQGKVCPPGVPPSVCQSLASAQQNAALGVAKGIASVGTSVTNKVKSWF